MNLLLDTHVALWALTGNPRLTAPIRSQLSDQRNEVTVSVVTIWEIAIKAPLARRGIGAMPVGAREALDLCRRAGYRIITVSPEHAIAVESLPPLHNDPFDRLLVAQALEEPLRLVTHDAAVAAYSDTIIRF